MQSLHVFVLIIGLFMILWSSHAIRSNILNYIEMNDISIDCEVFLYTCNILIDCEARQRKIIKT